jgi:hypothetical protein
MNKKQILNLLEQKLFNYPHNIEDKPISMAEWATLGRPFCWSIIHQDEEIVALIDSAYGQLALVSGNDIHTGAKMVTLHDYVLLSRYYTNQEEKLYKEVKPVNT